jgi:hypothetical protein
MMLRGSHSGSGAWLVMIAGVLSVLAISCESLYDRHRPMAADPSGRSDPPALSAGAQRGRQLFQAVGGMGCHDNLSSQQVSDLVDYLESLKTGQARAGARGGAPAPRTGVASAGAGGETSVVTTGGRLWGRTCGECHNLRPPSEYSDAQWAVAVHHMRIRVPLTGQQQREILAFLQASN